MTSNIAAGIFILACTVLAVGAPSGEEVSPLDGLPGADIPVQMSFNRTPLSKVVGALAAAGPFEVAFEDGTGEIMITVQLEKQSLKNALAHLAQRYDLAYAVPRKGHLVVKRRAGARAAE